nr:hypothetical protein CFP56_09294 [Quercus suber]
MTVRHIARFSTRGGIVCPRCTISHGLTETVRDGDATNISQTDFLCAGQYGKASVPRKSYGRIFGPMSHHEIGFRS